MAAVAGYEEATAPFVLRSRGYVERFFDGLDMVAPGVVQFLDR
jgi:S-adenosyl methyltransferase